VSFSTATGHFTQIPSGKADECNGDFSTTIPLSRQPRLPLQLLLIDKAAATGG
jgi:hypothetical protein